ncbi:MAG: hypothetical protein M3Z49_10765, partial [Bifidobacteriales bacterium]|nr:hypothetical protein [Bifidobacteriales bacterium]
PCHPDDDPPINPPLRQEIRPLYVHDTYPPGANANPMDSTLNCPRFNPENTLSGALAMVL